MKTCDELIIGSYSMLPRRSCKKKQKYLKRWKKLTNMIGDDKPSNVQVWDHPYITSVKGVGGWGRKMVNFADIQYCIYADIVKALSK